MTSKVSVIIPAYNKADFTVLAIRSVLNQTYKNIECIVVDDGSTDDTYDKIFPYDAQIKYIYQFNKGASSARNRGIIHASGDYIAFLDCDDMYLQSKIEFSVNYMNSRKIGMVYNDAFLIDKNNKLIGLYRPKKVNLLFHNSICNSVMIRKEVFKKVGLFDEELFTCADWDMWLRIEEHYRIGHIKIPLTLYRT